MIISIDQNGIYESNWLLEAVLNCSEDQLRNVLIQGKPVISLVGGGGKTTCVKSMAYECYHKGICAVVATTTHMQMPHDSFLLDTEDIDAFDVLMREQGQVWLGKRLEPDPDNPNMVRNKSRSLSIEFVRKVCSDSPYPVFIEADGARCLPLKAPAEHEPVIIPETTHVINVCGLDVLGETFRDMAFRPELICALLGREENDPVTTRDLASLALSPAGGRKGVEPGMDYQVILNKADNDERTEKAMTVAEDLIREGVRRVHITSGLSRLMTHTADRKPV